ncbi:DUF695 domain-containing protein [Arthrobacter yangruifuii]|uniref:DUF695 domain-containing protein n=1 Tax=Arthrobacter yangruifuii TaxID=2606616 RepID=A0A5N6MK77_9MICC|nr:DUF695 domain-containing protein [Arthrobacter yangruifuii]KAD3633138.1 DUF695 domain-containing protein [Arthrobacter yangruifuii]
MGIFSRRVDQPVPMHPVTAFWQWWSLEGADRFTAAADTGQWDSPAREMGEHLAAVHPDLAWDTAAGRSARHLLAVSSGGDAALRRIAEQWLRAAPAPDGIWEYAAARQPVADIGSKALTIEDRTVDFRDLRFDITEDPGGARLHVDVCHPEFPRLGDRGAQQVAFLALDWTLGEDGVERWVGGVRTSGSAATATASVSDLSAAAAGLAAREREGSWVLMEAAGPAGERIIAKARRPLRWIDYPLLDLHTEVHLSYGSRQEDGLPAQDALDGLRRIEDGISAALGPRGILVAQETAGGTRVLHYYSDSEDANGGGALEAAARAAGGEARHTPDPGWKRVRRFS